MKTKRNMSQMKEKDKGTAKDLNETERSNTPDKVFKVKIIELLTRPVGVKKVNLLSKNFYKEIEIIKQNQSVMKNSITKKKKKIEDSSGTRW